MKRKLTTLSRQYLTALRKHLRHGPRTSLRSAHRLGRQAVATGLETLDLAKIHQRALATLEASSSRDGVIKRAELFFKEAINPIEKIHQAALIAGARLTELDKELVRRTADLAASNRSLKQSIVRRKQVELALKYSGDHSRKLLKESRGLQRHLQKLSRQILTAQENKRQKLSAELQDEIAQILLGINVRLLSLKTEAALNAEGFKKDIASTQRLVNRSVTTIKRFARKFVKRHEA
jgi:signal transduction histidine kinase